MKRLKKLLPDILIGLLFIVGLSVLIYPTFSNWWNGKVQSRAVASYDEAVSDLSSADYISIRDKAETYNEAVRKAGTLNALTHPEEIPGYEETLNVTGTGVMGTITIDKIGVNLPIYHGTSDSVLSAGAGHLEGTSLPIGGEGNHSVISAHRGLPSSKLFTDLDKLSIGDIFTLHVLGDDLDYEIDQIVTVLPSALEALYLCEGEDYCTLMTCTPYGINTHRLLLRGHRIWLTSEEKQEREAAEESLPVTGRRIVEIIITVVAAIAVVLIMSQIIVMILRRRKK